MQVDLLELMNSVYRIQGVQMLCFPMQKESLANIDYGFRGKMFEGYNYHVAWSRMDHLIQPGIIYQFEDDLKLYYMCLRLPDSIKETTDIQSILIGPVLFRSLSTGTFQDLMEHYNIPHELHWEVQEFYNRIPVISYYDTWNNTLCFFLSQLCGQSLESRLIRDGEIELFQTACGDYHITPVPDIALKTIEDRYTMETKMLNAVTAGDMKHALEYHYQFRQYKILPRTPDPLRNQKNLTFTLNTLLRKAVQAGNVHPLHIDNLSRQFAIQIESVSSAAQLESLSTSMVRKYCMLVKNYSRKAYSSLIQTCMDYIDFHYSDDLSLDYMATMCSVSNSYLSALFKKETDTTLTDYINGTRVRQSLSLLNTTNLSIQEIAAQCGFSDSNYFTRTFKKFQGKSPKTYRESIRSRG